MVISIAIALAILRNSRSCAGAAAGLALGVGLILTKDHDPSLGPLFRALPVLLNVASAIGALAPADQPRGT